MSNFSYVNPQDLQAIAAKLENLQKSFSAPYAGMQNAGRTGTAAISIDSLEPVVRSLTIEDEDFLLTKNIQTMPAKQTVYSYVLKTAVGTGVDTWGTQSYLPQEDIPQYLRVAETLKIQGIRKTITDMAAKINDAGGYMVDLQAEMDQDAALILTQDLERSLYVGGDMYLGMEGQIDGNVANSQSQQVRHIRGIQAQITEGNKSARGIIGDFIAYGNNKSTVFDEKGAVLSRPSVDRAVSAVRDNRGRIVEAHCTTDQLRHFRSTFFPFERGDLGASYAIKGADVNNEPKAGFSLQTTIGFVDFVPSVFKYMRVYPIPVHVGGNALVMSTITAGTQQAGTTSFKNGDEVRYVVQAAGIKGISEISNELVITVSADGNRPVINIPFIAGAEEFLVFRTAVGEASGTWKFCGKVVASPFGSVFVDSQAILPGLDSIVMLPKQDKRAKLAVLGSLVEKTTLGKKGLVDESIYVSYLACVLEMVRHHALLRNVYSELDDEIYGTI